MGILCEALAVRPDPLWIWAPFLLSAGLFGSKIRAIVRLLRSARPEPRTGHLSLRLKYLLTDVFLQPRLHDPGIRLAHLAIFWGFLIYAGSFGLALAGSLFPFLSVPAPEEIGPLNAALELFGLLVLAGVLVALIRRIFFPPPGLKISGDAFGILALIALLMLSSLVGSAARAALDPAAGWSPAGTFLARFLPASAGPETLANLQSAMWWVHMVTVLGFLAYLPSSKHLHLLFAPVNVFLATTEPAGRLRPGEDSEAEKLLPADFSWRELLSALSCAECGRCDRACPSFLAGERLSPQKVVHELKELLLHPPAPARPDGKGLPGGGAGAEALWQCATCYSCVEHCPVRNEHLPIIMRMRRHLMARGEVDARLQETLTSLSRYGNSFGQSERQRTRWTQGLPFAMPDARKTAVEYLWYLGDTASFDPRVQEATRAMALLFHTAGVDVGILHEGERTAGNDVRRSGEEGLFEMLQEKNVAALGKASFGAIVTTDPHTYNTLKNEYEGRHGRPVYHATELLAGLLDAGRLKPRRNGRLRATYHDPCYLGRYNGVYDAPRKVLEAVGVELVEMPRSRQDALCCGAGGGRIWMEDRPGARSRPADLRVHEAADTVGTGSLITACPKDTVMFVDAVKSSGLEDRLKVRDIATVVLDRLDHVNGKE